jgi:alkanesulfonate monooxygenase SsuD/methylene tetrahydromethanopterin reductase-like flavin-dependent oxidoreductase (luciferase family)
VTGDGPSFPIPEAKLYTTPARPIPIYVAASGPQSAVAAGELGDGWISDAVPAPSQVASAYEAGVAASGRRRDEMRLLVEMYCVVGDEAEALEAARLWQFGPLMGEVINEWDPRLIQRRAEEASPPERVVRPWLVSRDPAEHVERIRRLFEAGVTDVYVHSPQSDQRKVIDFYAGEVLPRLALNA